jgi:hypothetical protein
MATQDPQRTRTQVIVIRLNEHERDALDRVSKRLALSLSETVRHLIRREDEAAPATTKKGGKR